MDTHAQMTQMSHRILSLISHSVGVARLDHFHDEVGSGTVRAEVEKLFRQMQGKEGGGQKGKTVHPLCTVERTHSQRLSGWKTFPFLLIMQHFSVRLVSYIQGNVWGGVMFLGVQLTGKQKLEVPIASLRMRFTHQ